MPAVADLPYAAPRVVTDLAECKFYHTMDLPGYGTIPGAWDLRGRLDEYLGGVSFRGKRVLEVGTASGCLCFHMERQGAEVVAYDLSEDHDWDIVPLVQSKHRDLAAVRRQNIRKLNNAWWLAHRALRSRARVVYGTVYTIPEAIGPVDVATMCCVLLHVRDPFLALARAAAHAREKVVVVDGPCSLHEAESASPRVPLSFRQRVARRLSRWVKESVPYPPAISCMAFKPDALNGGPLDTWWVLTPELVCRFLGVLGFDDTWVTYHEQFYDGRPLKLFTVVAQRTRGAALAA